MEKKLIDVMADVADTDIARSKLRATVTKQIGDTDYTIQDETHEVTLEVTPKHKEKIQVGFVYEFYSPEKISARKIRLNKASYAKKLFEDPDVKKSEDRDKTIRIGDLKTRKNKSQVKDALVARVLAKYDTRKVTGGKQLR